MRPYKDFLLVSDMDGTLLTSAKTVSEANKKAIREFVDGGGRFAIATGRTPDNAKDYLQGVAVNSPSIFYNGSLLADLTTGQVLKSCPLEGRLWRDFVRTCLKTLPGLCLEVYTAKDCYILSDEQYDDPRMAAEYSSYHHASLEKVARLEWLKFFVCAPHEKLEQVRDLAERLQVTAVSNNFYSAENYLEFVGPQVSKGNMMEVLRALPENAGRLVVAAGDYPNDNEMLRRADCGVAPADAAEETRALAARLGPDCDHDLWDFIIREVLPAL